jgi:hypothetical protein
MKNKLKFGIVLALALTGLAAQARQAAGKTVRHVHAPRLAEKGGRVNIRLEYFHGPCVYTSVRTERRIAVC